MYITCYANEVGVNIAVPLRFAKMQRLYDIEHFAVLGELKNIDEATF